MQQYLRLFLVIFCSLILVSCATPVSFQQTPEFTVFSEIPKVEKVELFDKIAKISEQSVGHPLNVLYLRRNHTEIYAAMSRAETLKTRIAVRYQDGIITAILDETSVNHLSGFVQLDIRTKRLLFNFGSTYGFLVTRLTDEQMKGPASKLAEIRTYYSASEGTPFQFYYDTLANLEIFTGIYFEEGKLQVFMNGTSLTKDYDRYNQKDRCGADLFWGLFELIVFGKELSKISTGQH
jgi:hypothetical protein